MPCSLKKIFCYLVLVGIYLNGCQNTAPQSQMDEFDVKDQHEKSGVKGGAASKGEAKLARIHPKEPTAWFTRRILLANEQPTATLINECKERVESSVKDAPNLKALNEVSLTLKSEIRRTPTVYHWCFYQIMADLDIKLENEAPLMEDKAELFLQRMKILWALGNSLDLVLDSEVYMTYLRARYTDISQNTFGRNLELVDAESFSMPTVGSGKAAAKFEE